MLRALDRFFDPRRDLGALFVRLAVGFHLVHGTQDNVFSWHRMLEFRDFLAANGFPWPLPGAVVSAWAQLLCGVLYFVGLFVRPAALVMIVNFVLALLIAHRNGGYPSAAPAVMMLAASLFLLFHGAGAASLDRRLRTGSDPLRAR